METCRYCGRKIYKNMENFFWYHIHSKRPACDRGQDGHITLARPCEN